ncbi:hypothetical protein OG369_37500 [Streptomyces sp. NBC_01221]|uniref:hypothetical protein n=1 Tax=Streptomyces sp. NBC_01221 TaxID=2903782 RepID=UPI00225C20DA|nr:hypothetical protein [Streptomyces sp. NBC_01221]MCX4791591.1 hypothetical protein [Streptomyces sp. NBC_01221]
MTGHLATLGGHVVQGEGAAGHIQRGRAPSSSMTVVRRPLDKPGLKGAAQAGLLRPRGIGNGNGNGNGNVQRRVQLRVPHG